jgi:hypothetical protein
VRVLMQRALHEAAHCASAVQYSSLSALLAQHCDDVYKGQMQLSEQTHCANTDISVRMSYIACLVVSANCHNVHQFGRVQAHSSSDAKAAVSLW